MKEEILFERLKKAKELSGLQNADIAEKSGVSLSTVEKILAGQTKGASVTNFSAICKAIGTTMDYVCYGRTSQPPPSEHEKKVLEVEK